MHGEPVGRRIQAIIRLQDFAALCRHLAGDWTRFAGTRPLMEAGRARTLAQNALYEADELERLAAEWMRSDGPGDPQ